MDKWLTESHKKFKISRNRAKAKATLLAMSARMPLPMLTTCIVDTGAGVNHKCAASGLATSKTKKMVLQNASGQVTTDRITRIKFRRIGLMTV